MKNVEFEKANSNNYTDYTGKMLLFVLAVRIIHHTLASSVKTECAQKLV